ncbi:hypothetical protein OOK41_00165 [Micromonospora sp. NBC_01655]|uniref:hypothetical protein n=1 Tax=Micromonospora sp. NBC_01655 TaxID=2975983 RepID=UPI002255D5E2|nr:hypothetical protein [Micromonospora sp. NBC_01655]MCX4468745.1 hypothetical protein [Micromonospora sp. NBC_01655]
MQRIAPAPATPPTAASPIISGPTNGTRAPGQVHPGEDFNARTEWSQVLGVAGWRDAACDDDVTYWTRPGKPTGISASTNALGTDRLHVFTTSAAPLDGGESYSKFGAYAALHFGGDHKAAARALGQQGFGSGLPDPATEQATMIRDLVGHLHQPGPATATPTAAGSPATEPTRPTRPTRPYKDLDPGDRRPQPGRRRRLYAKRRGMSSPACSTASTPSSPREGEDEHVPITDVETNDGPARYLINDSTLANGSPTPTAASAGPEKAKRTCPSGSFPARRTHRHGVPGMPSLQVLRGVIHPVVRPDGGLIEAPGYDPATGLASGPASSTPTAHRRRRPRCREAAPGDDRRIPLHLEHYRPSPPGALLTRCCGR